MSTQVTYPRSLLHIPKQPAFPAKTQVTRSLLHIPMLPTFPDITRAASSLHPSPQHPQAPRMPRHHRHRLHTWSARRRGIALICEAHAWWLHGAHCVTTHCMWSIDCSMKCRCMCTTNRVWSSDWSMQCRCVRNWLCGSSRRGWYLQLARCRFEGS